MSESERLPDMPGFSRHRLPPMTRPPGDVSLSILNNDPDPWKVDEPRTTVLVALIPGDDPPTEFEVVAAAESVFGRTPDVTAVEQEDAASLWSHWLEFGRDECPLLVSAMPAAEKPGDGELDEAARACRWAVRIEGVLDRSSCVESFVRLMRFAAAIREDIPAVLDVESCRWHLRQSLDVNLLPDGAMPQTDVLWIIHAVHDGETVWLHTHGLARCGVPELEMIQVPEDVASAAARLLNDLGEQLLEFETPQPGQVFAIGQQLDLTIHPWETIARDLGHESAASVRARREIDGREGVDDHQGVRAVVCGPTPRGTLKSVWTWPEKAVARYVEKNAVVYKSSEASRRDERLARKGWPTFATAFACAQKYAREHGVSIAEFLVKAGFDASSESSNGCVREHLWFEAVRVEGDTAEGTLLNVPTVVRSLQEGCTTLIQRDQVSDWQIRTSMGVFGPGCAAAAMEAIDTLRVERA